MYADVFSKAIPVRRRGRFTGWRQLLGYLAAIGAGWMVKVILEDVDRWPFPDNYAVIFLFSAVSLLVAFVGFAMIKEPEYPAHRVSESMRHLLRRAVGLARNNPNFRRFLWARGLTDVVLALGPFYIVYALNERGIDLAMVGVYLSVQMAGAALSNLVWGGLGDRIGNRAVVLGTAVTGLLTPAAALLVPLHPGFFLLVFASMGATISGVRLGYSDLILEMADVELRPTCVALQNTLLAPVTLLPLVVAWPGRRRVLPRSLRCRSCPDGHSPLAWGQDHRPAKRSQGRVCRRVDDDGSAGLARKSHRPDVPLTVDLTTWQRHHSTATRSAELPPVGTGGCDPATSS